MKGNENEQKAKTAGRHSAPFHLSSHGNGNQRLCFLLPAYRVESRGRLPWQWRRSRYLASDSWSTVAESRVVSHLAPSG